MYYYILRYIKCTTIYWDTLNVLLYYDTLNVLYTEIHVLLYTEIH